MIWLYQSLMQAKKANMFYWIAGCFVVFMFALFLMDSVCIEIIEALKGKGISEEYDPRLTEIGDRKTQEDAGGLFMPALCELLPSIVSFTAIAVIRVLFITKQALTPANLFSGIKDMFISIKDSFKTTSN
jgi:hypothetical protein